MSADWLHAGRVGRPHGLDGSFHVIGPNPRLLQSGAVLRVAGAERTIDRRAGHDARVILRLDGCSDRSGAEALRGEELLVARAAAPELGPDEWWAEELEGCAVRDGARAVGVVRRLLELPSCEVLEVERADGGADLLVPLVSDAVREVDTERREIDIDLDFLGAD
ncbi:MAG TPA: ribosome maturation factor RimM [Solirubrobacteraceae bacterium]|nr:ribosome maturation factor RimM [Solirubrobacteraceae bacterium]